MALDTAELCRHWSQRSVSYDRFVVKGFADSRERSSWQKLFSSALPGSDAKVLDTGCGPGIVSMQLADLGYSVTALDFSESMLEMARKNAADNGLSIDFVRGDACDLPFPDASFDAVVSDYMLWTVPDPEKVMSEWYRVLRLGGTLAYVDGDWFNDPRSTRLRCAVSRWAVRVDDPERRKEDADYPSEGHVDLWSAAADRPSDDLRMLASAGFGNVTVTHNVQRKVLHGIRYLAHGLTNDHFMVRAVKPEEV